MLTSGSLIALPSWAKDWEIGALIHHRSSFSFPEQNTLAAVADTIIPAGNSLGALSVGVDKFLQKLLDDCYGKEVQDNVKLQLQGLDTTAQAAHAKSFSECDQQQRQQLLQQLSSGNQAEKDFFSLMKSETIRGFNTSREVMVDYLKYKPAPGYYYGCVDVKV